MNKTFQYRLYPTRKQSTIFIAWLKLCCETYNAALQERRDAYQIVGKSISYAQQCAELPACKEVRPDLAEVPAQVLQDVVKRVDLAFDAFFRRCAAGEKPGYPRFKARMRYDSLTGPAVRQQLRCSDGQKAERDAHPREIWACQNGHASAAVWHPKDSDCETDANGQVVCVHFL